MQEILQPPHGLRQVPAAETVGEPAGVIVGQGLADTEGSDEGEYGAVGGNPEGLLHKLGKDAPLQAHHAPHETVDNDQQGELLPVVPESELYFVCHSRMFSGPPFGQR